MKRSSLTHGKTFWALWGHAALVMSAFFFSCSLAALTTPKLDAGLADKDSKILQTAMKSIKETLRNASGTPYRVSCQLQLQGETPVAERTELHFSNYHRPAETRKRTHQPRGKVTRVVEVVYKPKLENHVDIIERDAKSLARLATRSITVNKKKLTA